MKKSITLIAVAFIFTFASAQPGSLDLSFSSDGKVTTDFGSVDYGFSVAIQTDGKIVVAGYSDNGSNEDFALVRYNVDGGTGINDVQLATGDVQIYPNPFSHSTTIEIYDLRITNYDLKIYNVLGEEVYDQILNTKHSILICQAEFIFIN